MTSANRRETDTVWGRPRLAWPGHVWGFQESLGDITSESYLHIPWKSKGSEEQGTLQHYGIGMGGL